MGERLYQGRKKKKMTHDVFDDPKHLKKPTDFESVRSYSAGNKQKERTNEEIQSVRTRSVSPRASYPPLTLKLPLKKFYNIYSKIVMQLETLKSLAENKSNETETFLDLRRQLQRADEFSIRFSRNNLYDTRRIYNEIKNLIVPYPFHKLNSNECKFLCKKIILGYQAASQSLQCYINYVKNAANLELPEKIIELVLVIADLFLCCEHLSLPNNEVFIQNDAIRICNELVTVLKSKMTVGEYVVLKQEDFSKRKINHLLDGGIKVKTLSMYKAKPNAKVKPELAPKKKFGVPCLLGNKARKVKKKDEKKARITHEIYTQKLNSRHTKNSWSKALKFESAKSPAECEKNEGAVEKKQLVKKSKFFTPREVRSQDDDIETMVQTIEDDEVVTSRLCSNFEEVEKDSVASSSFNKSSFRDLLLEAVQELQSSDKKEHKAALKKILHSIQHCSKNQDSSPEDLNVKLFYFKSKDLEEEEKEDKKIESWGEAENANFSKAEETDLANIECNVKNNNRTLERNLNLIFKPIKQKKEIGNEEQAEKGKIHLRLPETSMKTFRQYKKSFTDYTVNNIMYKQTLATKPWELVEKIADRILLDIIEEVADDFESDVILNRLYLNEFVDAIN